MSRPGIKVIGNDSKEREAEIQGQRGGLPQFVSGGENMLLARKTQRLVHRLM